MENRRPYDDIERYGGLMEVSSPCSRFERRFDFDVFSMSDYQSCENCRHLGAGDRCGAWQERNHEGRKIFDSGYRVEL